MLRLFLSLQFRKIVILAIVKATRTGCTYFSGSSTDKKKNLLADIQMGETGML